MYSECDKCGLEDPECQCYVNELSERVLVLEKSMRCLTIAIDHILDILQSSDER